MQISTNGFISVEGDFITDSFEVMNFPRRDANSIFPMIAPLWADFNFREEGRIFYRVVNDNSTLTAIAERIASHNHNYTDYAPTEAVIVTWFQSRLFERDVLVRSNQEIRNVLLNGQCIHCLSLDAFILCLDRLMLMDTYYNCSYVCSWGSICSKLCW